MSAEGEVASPSLRARLAAPFVEFGWAAGTLYLIDRLMRWTSPQLGLEVFEFMVQPIVAKPMLPANLAKNLNFAEIGRGDPAIAEMPAREDIKARRFEQGARCLGAYRKGELIGYLWFCTGRYREDVVRCTYELVDPAHSIFDFDLYVMPKHRLGLGFLGIWHGANQFLAPKGVRYTFSRLTRFNTASRRAHAHLGWRRVGRALFLRAGRVEMMLGTLAPYLTVTFGSRQYVNLKLAPDVLLAAQPAPSTAPVESSQ